jgi:hypothetical protein
MEARLEGLIAHLISVMETDISAEDAVRYSQAVLNLQDTINAGKVRVI